MYVLGQYLQMEANSMQISPIKDWRKILNLNEDIRFVGFTTG